MQAIQIEQQRCGLFRRQTGSAANHGCDHMSPLIRTVMSLGQPGKLMTIHAFGRSDLSALGEPEGFGFSLGAARSEQET
jgi:hypothetical protein